MIGCNFFAHRVSKDTEYANLKLNSCCEGESFISEIFIILALVKHT